MIITIARKPLVGTVVQNVLEYGCGALNIDGCRIGTGTMKQATAGVRTIKWGVQEGAVPMRRARGPPLLLKAGGQPTRFLPQRLFWRWINKVASRFPQARMFALQQTLTSLLTLKGLVRRLEAPL